MNKKNRIAFLGLKYFPSKGGTSRVIENLILNLNREYDITLYCYKNKSIPSQLKIAKIVQIPQIPLGSCGVFIYYLLCALHALLFLKADIIHIHKVECAIFIKLLSIKYKIIATSHEMGYLRDKWSFVGKLYFRLMEVIFINSSAILTTISEPLSKYYFKKYKKKVIFIPNGVDCNNKYNEKSVNRILRKHKINSPYIIFAARRIMATKGAHTLLEALIQNKYSGKIIIAGDDTQLPQYTKRLKILAKTIDVHFIGFINSIDILLDIIKRAELFIFPSEVEGMSIMLLEVASVGTPIICSDIPENKSVFSSEEVLFFKNKSVIDLSEKIKWAFNNPKSMQKIANNAKLKVVKQYFWKKIVEQYSAVYNKLCEMVRK